MYCPECRETGRFPWHHDDDCKVGLRQWVTTLRATVGVLLVALVPNTVLLVAVLAMMGEG